MLMQTNSYVVPRNKRAEHARLLRRFRQVLRSLGCVHFEAYEQAQPNWGVGEPSGRFVQIMKFRDRRHQQSVQATERDDPVAQQLIAEFCELINLPYQQQQGLFVSGFYHDILPSGSESGGESDEAHKADMSANTAEPLTDPTTPDSGADAAHAAQT